MTHHRDILRRSPRGFTLIELVVVIGIMILLVAIAAPAVGPALSSNYQSQASTLFAGILAQAQARGAVAVRIERACKTDKFGMMVDAYGRQPDDAAFTEPAWLGYQQVRFLRPIRGGSAFEAEGDPVKLSAGAWLAPSYALQTDSTKPWYFNPGFMTGNWQPPALLGSPKPVPYSPLDTFYIAFDPNGAIVTVPFGGGLYTYHDRFQVHSHNAGGGPTVQYVSHPHDSARGVIVYDRKRLEEFTTPNERGTYLSEKGQPYYINRFLGTLIGGEQP